MRSARVQERLLPAMSHKMILRTTFLSNTLMVDVYLSWEMKVLGLDEQTDYARDIFGPSWLKFDELRYEHARKSGTNTKIMSKPFEITEQKHKPGNNPSLMHHEAHAESLHSAFPYSFLVKTLWRLIPHKAQCSDHTPTTCWDNPESAGQETIRLWSLLTGSAAYRSPQKISCCRDWRKGRKARV